MASASLQQKIEISQKTILQTLGILLGILVVYKIRQIILLLFISFVIMTALKPAVKFFERFKINRAWSIVCVYTTIWLVIGVTLAALIPLLVVQTRHLITTLPAFVENFQFLNTHQSELTTQLISLIGSLPENVLKIASNVFGNILNLLTTLVISFYFLTERENLEKYLEKWLGKKRSSEISGLVTEVEHRLGGWVRGELLLMLSVGILTYVGLIILGVDTALPLAILAGLLEIVPNIGPTLSTVPAAIFAYTVSPFLALSTIALYFLVQNLENSFLVPVVMSKVAGVNPLISLLGLIIGFELVGITGAVLAIPSILVIETVVSRFFPPNPPKE